MLLLQSWLHVQAARYIKSLGAQGISLGMNGQNLNLSPES
ncbi:hypothetical protein SAMN04487965_2671 [Microbulbifer donghaiensis]|uniref:Uncharacterized protein n=1 Tax=Microbulbifer donghaiensis TaxID=494016 RepID=A0A1M5EE59_9GAMM|nr:hypothetical protein SAMN04487965_2671 [Microbulbifer donghaiensis]